ncbi:MAG: 50S ribosomal protein L10 [Candidatus Korarchaeota archaeon]
MSVATLYKPKGERNQNKAQELKEITEILKKYNSLLVVQIDHLSSNFIKEFKKKYSDRLKLIMTKNTLLKKAFALAGIKVPEEYIYGQTAVILSNESLVDIMSIILKETGNTHIKAGHKTPVKVTIPSGSTGLPVSQIGPLLAELGILTSVQKGIVHILKETHVANPGDDVDPKVALLLLMLGIKPIEMKFIPILGICGNVLITKDSLFITREKIYELLVEGIRNNNALTEQLGIITEANAPKIIARGWREAHTLATIAGIIDSDTAEDVVKLAIRQALLLSKSAKLE